MSGIRQNLHSSRKFTIVPTPSSGLGTTSNAADSSNRATNGTGNDGATGYNNMPQQGPMGRSLKFHSMRSVRGK